MSVVELRLYDATNTTHLAVLDKAYGLKYSDVLSDVGAGSFSIPLQDPAATTVSQLLLINATDQLLINGADGLGWTTDTDKAALVTCGKVVRVRLDNTDVGAFVIDDLKQDDVLVNRVLTASGRTLLSMLERAIVYPSDTANYATMETTYLAKCFGYIMRTEVAAAAARGVAVLSTDFTNTKDSDNVSFTDSNTIKYRAGSSLMEMALQHADYGIEITVSPAGVLHYYIPGGAGQNRATTVFLREGLNVLKAGRGTSQANLFNAVLGEGQYILSPQTDATSIAAYGRRERLAQHGNVSDATTLATLTQADRDNWKNPQVMVSLAVNDDTLTPFVSYGLGDTVTVVLPSDGVNTSFRIRAISLEQADGGHVNVQVTLNSLIDEYLIKLNKGLKRKFMSPINPGDDGNSDPNVGGWNITNTELSAASGLAVLSSTGYIALGSGNDYARLDAADATYRLWIGNSAAASAPFRVTKGGALTATNATVSGSVTATDGSVGGWTINNTYLAKDTGTASTSAGMAPSDYPFYAGQTYANRATAPFRVTPAGALTATSGAIGGWTLGTTSLTAGSAGNTVGLDSGGTNPAIYAGSATPASAPFRVTKAGAVTATSGEIGGWTLGATSLVAGSAGNTVGLDSGGTNPAIYAGSATPGSAPFRVTKAGALTATSGAIGGWTLGASTLTGGDTELSNTGVVTVGTTNDVAIISSADATYRLWIGNATAASAPFRVTKAGYVTATSGSIGGFTLSGTSFYSGDFKLDASNKRIYVSTGNYIQYSSGKMDFVGTTSFQNDVVLINGLDMSGGTGDISMGTGSYIFGKNLQVADNVGFFGTAATTKRTVSGSRGSNAALASLLTALAAYGLITDSSS